jgi:hypothetical protein
MASSQRVNMVDAVAGRNGDTYLFRSTTRELFCVMNFIMFGPFNFGYSHA